MLRLIYLLLDFFSQICKLDSLLMTVTVRSLLACGLARCALRNLPWTSPVSAIPGPFCGLLKSFLRPNFSRGVSFYNHQWKSRFGLFWAFLWVTSWRGVLARWASGPLRSYAIPKICGVRRVVAVLNRTLLYHVQRHGHVISRSLRNTKCRWNYCQLWVQHLDSSGIRISFPTRHGNTTCLPAFELRARKYLP